MGFFRYYWGIVRGPWWLGAFGLATAVVPIVLAIIHSHDPWMWVSIALAIVVLVQLAGFVFHYRQTKIDQRKLARKLRKWNSGYATFMRQSGYGPPDGVRGRAKAPDWAMLDEYEQNYKTRISDLFHKAEENGWIERSDWLNTIWHPQTGQDLREIELFVRRWRKKWDGEEDQS